MAPKWQIALGTNLQRIINALSSLSHSIKLIGVEAIYTQTSAHLDSRLEF
jgi:hypothetical protein